MRQIKFRGKRCSDGSWVYGSYLESNLSWQGHKPHKSWIVSNAYSNGGWLALIGRTAVKEDTIGQFTGMRDDSGTEIWEGDIVRMIDRPYNLVDIGKVIYNAQLGRYSLEVVKGNETRRYAFIKSEIVNDGNARVPVTYLYEVIGNIYDNPELLNE